MSRGAFPLPDLSTERAKVVRKIDPCRKAQMQLLRSELREC
jgi:hypothetical protein